MIQTLEHQYLSAPIVNDSVFIIGDGNGEFQLILYNCFPSLDRKSAVCPLLRTSNDKGYGVILFISELIPLCRREKVFGVIDRLDTKQEIQYSWVFYSFMNEMKKEIGGPEENLVC